MKRKTTFIVSLALAAASVAAVLPEAGRIALTGSSGSGSIPRESLKVPVVRRADGTSPRQVRRAETAGETVFSETFPSYEAFRQWTILDKNNDYICWDWTADYGAPFVYCYGTDSYDNITANDWIISPDIELQKNHAYRVVATVGLCGYTEEKVEVFLGRGKKAEAMTIPAIESTLVTEEMAYGADIASGKLLIAEDGVYNLGVHMTSDGGSHGLSLLGVTVSDLGLQDPDAFEPQRIYLEQFETRTAFDAFSTVDMNGGYGSWSHNNSRKCAQYTYGARAADDWLITPSLPIQAGRDYKLRFKVETASCAERLEVMLGTSALVADLTQVVVEPADIEKRATRQFETVFKVKTNQPHYIGFHAISDADMDKIYLDDIEIWDMGPNGDTPEEPGPQLPEGLPVPYVADLTDPTVFATYTVVDANADTRTWKYDIIFNSTLYNFSKENAADDWLITPYIKLEKDKAYKLTIDVKGRGPEYPEKVEAFVGTGMDVADFTIEAIAPTVLTMDKAEPVVTLSSRRIQVPDDGVYTVGVHAISDANMSDLEIHGLRVEEVYLDAPKAVTDLVAVADPTGELKATLSFSAPTSNIGDTEIEGNLSKIEIYRGETLIKVFTDVTPGEEKKYDDEDTDIMNGINQYSVLPYVGEHAGDVAQTNLFIGADLPQRVTGFAGEDLGDRIRFTWNEVPNVGQNGGAVYPAAVKYNIYATFPEFFMGQVVNIEYQLLESVTGADEALIDYAELNKGEHETIYFSVKPENKAGEAGAANTSMLKGKPYQLPYEESFTGSAIHSYLSWDSNCSDDNSGLYMLESSADGDGSSLGFVCYDNGSKYMAVFSGKLDIENAQKPTLEFAASSAYGSNTLVVQAQLPDGATIELARYVPGSSFSSKCIELPEAVKDFKWVRLVFAAEFPAYVDDLYGNELAIDAIKVHDAAMSGIDGVATVEEESKGADLFAPDGRLLRRNATDTRGLRGIVISRDSKVFVK